MRALAGGTALALTLLAAPCVAQQGASGTGQAQGTAQFNIPAQSLTTAVTAFGDQAGLQVTVDGAILTGLSSQPVVGRFSPAEALSRLLAGTGITYRWVDSRSVALERAPQSADGAVQLGPVRVEGTSGSGGSGYFSLTSDPAATEGTGTYAAQATTIFKGAKSLREIPQSVSIITREQIEDQGFNRIEDAFTQLPGVKVDGYAGIAKVFTRGFQTGLQVDGVPEAYFFGGSSYKLDPAIYDRIEMLRGPSGLFSGSAEPGGTINLVRKRPRDQFNLSGAVSYRSWNDARADLDITGPLTKSGSLRGRVVGVLQDRDMFYDVAHERRKLIYGALEADLTSHDTVGISATRTENVSNIFFGLPRYTDGSVPNRKNFVGTTDLDTVYDITDISIYYRHDFGNDFIFKSTYNHRKENNKEAGLYGYTAIDRSTGLADAGGSYYKSDVSYKALDLNITGPFVLFGQKHQVTFGYNSAIQSSETTSEIYPYFPASDILNRHNWGISVNDLSPAGYSTYYKQSGVYGSLNLRLLNPLSLIAGGRFTDYSSRSRLSYATPWVASNAKAKGQFTPFAGLVLDLTKQISIYGSYAEIFVPQSTMDYTQSVLPPRTGNQFELGIKGAFLDNKLNASLAIYQLRDSNRSIIDSEHSCPWVSNARCYRAAGKIQSRGIEAEVSGTPAPGLNLSASYTYNDSKFLADTNPDNVGKAPAPWADPTHLFKIWVQYSFNESSLAGLLRRWSMGAGVIAQSSVYNDASYLARPVHQDGYAIVSANIGYRVSEDAELIFDVGNIFDKKYLSTMGTDSYYNIYGEPRSVRLTLKYRFD